MSRKGKCVTVSLLIVIVIMLIGYVYIMALFEGPIIVRDSPFVRPNFSQKEIHFAKLIETYIFCDVYQRDGLDNQGNEYIHFMACLPNIFEGAEIHCIYCWTTHESILYIGEGRAMERINTDFSLVIWD